MPYQSRLEIVIDSRSGERNLRRVQRELSHTEQQGVQSFNSLRAAALGFAGVLGAMGVASFSRETFNAVKSAQSLQASLKTVTGSVEDANAAWSNLVEFAKETPFTLDQSVQAFIRMKSLGLDPTNDALRSFGNTASAMGKDMLQMVEAVADATTGEFERLKEFGIRASKEGDQISFTFQGVTTTVQNSADAITEYLEGIGSTNFAGAMAEQMDTLGGQASNLEDSIYQLYLAIGDAGATKVFGSALSTASEAVAGLTEALNTGELDGYLSAMEALAVLAGGRLTVALGSSATAIISKTAASVADARADATAAQQVMRRTGAELQSAKAMLSSIQLEAKATQGTNAHAFALQQLSAARVRATEAAGAHMAATNAASAAMTRASVAARGLSGAMALVGGPAGAAVVAAGAMLYFHDELTGVAGQAEKTTRRIDDLTNAINTNSEAAVKGQLVNLTVQLFDLERQAIDARKRLDELSTGNTGSGFLGAEAGRTGEQARAIQELGRIAEEMDAVGKSSDRLRGILDKLQAEGTAPTVDSVRDLAGGASEAKKDVEEFASSLLSLQDQLFPVEAAQRQYREEQKLLTQAWNNGTISAERYAEAMRRLEEAQLSEQSPGSAYSGMGFGSQIGDPMSGMGGGMSDPSYWDRWLESASAAFTDFDAMAATTAESFQRGFGQAFESMIFDSQNFGDAMYNLIDGMARTMINALGEMAAQWLAYQAVQLMVGKTAQSTQASSMVTNAMAKQQEAALNAFASTAAIPIVGPAMAPGAAAAALAATTPMVGAISSLAMAGMAHDGIDSVPREGTWLLDKGERVTGAALNRDLTQFLERENRATKQSENSSATSSAAAPIVNINEDASKAGTSKARTTDDGQWVIDVWVANAMSDGRVHSVMKNKYGVSTKGR